MSQRLAARLSAFLWMLLCALCWEACTSDSEREAGILVAVYTDLQIGHDFARLTAQVLDEGGKPTQEETFALESREHEPFVVSFGVKRSRQDLMRLRLTGFDAEGQTVIAQTLHARFRPRKVLLLRTFLSSNCYLQLSCQADESCEPNTGQCAPVAVLDALPARGAPGDEETAWFPEGYVPFSASLDAGADANPDPFWADADAGDAGSDVVGDACAEPSCEPCAAMCSTGCTELTSDPQHCGMCEHACPYGVCRGGSCVSEAEGPRSMEGEWLWEAQHLYGFRIENTHAARLASLVALVSRPDPSAELRMALFEDRYDTPQDPVAQSPALNLGSARVEWVIPPEERPLLHGGEKGYWLMFVLSEEAYLHVDERVRGFWRGAASVAFEEPIPEIPLELEYYPDAQGLPFPNLFLTIIPEPAP